MFRRMLNLLCWMFREEKIRRMMIVMSSIKKSTSLSRNLEGLVERETMIKQSRSELINALLLRVGPINQNTLERSFNSTIQLMLIDWPAKDKNESTNAKGIR